MRLVMQRRRRKNWLLVSIILVGIILTVVGSYYIYRQTINKSKQEQKTTLELNTLPDITFLYGEYPINRLNGYVQIGDEFVNNVAMRHTITPLNASRQLRGYLDKKENKIYEIAYEVRSLNGENLIEDGKVSIEREENNMLYWNIPFSNLLEENKEYLLTLEVTTEEKGEIYYYTRLYYEAKEVANSILNYANEFSKATIEKNSNNDIIIGALKPNNNTSTTDLSVVNLSSKLDMITWKDVSPTRINDVAIKITEFNGTQMTMAFLYDVEGNGNYAGTYHVEENFCIRFRNNTMYVLDYERSCREAIKLVKERVSNSNILLGIGNHEVQVIADEKNKFYGIQVDGDIWYYHTEKQQLQQLLELGEDATIQLIQIKEDGTLDFIVKGYTNAGKFEGSVGVSIFRYRPDREELEQLCYFPINTSPMYAPFVIGEGIYINENDICYMMIEGKLLQINLTTRESSIVVEKDSSSKYTMSREHGVIIWEEGSDENYPDKVVIFNMENGEKKEIVASDDGFIHFQGLISTQQDKEIDYDLIYALGKKTTTPIANGSKKMIPWFSLEIANSNLEVETHYEIENVYIEAIQVGEGKVLLERLEKKENGYDKISSDLLLANQRVDSDKTTYLKSKVTEEKGREYYITLDSNPLEESTIMIENSNKNVVEVGEANPIAINQNKGQQSIKDHMYFVFGHGKLLDVTNRLSNAIDQAYDTMGVVLDGNYEYVYTRDARDLVKDIKIEQQQPVEQEKSLARCLSIVLEQIDNNTSGSNSLNQAMITMDNIQLELEQGKSVYDILKETVSIPILDVSQSQLEHLYYYINKDCYVLVVTNRGTGYIIHGYDSNNAVTIYESETGMSRKVLVEEVEQMLEEQGASLFTYLLRGLDS